MDKNLLKIDIISLFPEYFEKTLRFGPIRQAIEKRILKISVWNPRDFAPSPKEVDDYPYGGGSGMIMKPEPFFRAVDDITAEFPSPKRKIIFMTPQGKVFNQKMANKMAGWEHLIFLCGHYKGVDERVIEALVTDEISIGDYVLTGGELPTLVVVDAVVRLIPGVISDFQSAATDSFQQDELDHPHYTRPEEYRGMRVPGILLSGHHEKIEVWRKEQRLKRTALRRQDLLKKKLDQCLESLFMKSIKTINLHLNLLRISFS